jgi:hypothetical protein
MNDRWAADPDQPGRNRLIRSLTAAAHLVGGLNHEEIING